MRNAGPLFDGVAPDPAMLLRRHAPGNAKPTQREQLAAAYASFLANAPVRRIDQVVDVERLDTAGRPAAVRVALLECGHVQGAGAHSFERGERTVIRCLQCFNEEMADA